MRPARRQKHTAPSKPKRSQHIEHKTSLKLNPCTNENFSLTKSK